MFSGHCKHVGLQEDHSNWWPAETVSVGTTARDSDHQLQARTASRYAGLSHIGSFH